VFEKYLFSVLFKLLTYIYSSCNRLAHYFVIFCVHLEHPASPLTWCGQLRQNLVCMRATWNSLHRINYKCLWLYV